METKLLKIIEKGNVFRHLDAKFKRKGAIHWVTYPANPNKLILKLYQHKHSKHKSWYQINRKFVGKQLNTVYQRRVGE